jgi:transcriptional regulator of acetoin/glycerol metabolism
MMGTLQASPEAHAAQLAAARQLFFENGDFPDGLVSEHIIRSWQRCHRFGLTEAGPQLANDSLDRLALKTEQERNRLLLSHGRPIMEHVYEQIRESGSMVILANANGLLLETVGDPDFVDRADRVALMAGASWDENQRGTNAIGTTLADESPTEVLGGEHFLAHNNFLTCCASPIFGPDGSLLGVLDISGDYRHYQRHTLGLVRMSSQLVEKRLFEAEHANNILVCFHRRADCLASPREGLAAVSPDGQILAINRAGLEQLGLRPFDVVRRDFCMVFEHSLARLIDGARRDPQRINELRAGNHTLFVQVRGRLPAGSGQVYEDAQAPSRQNLRRAATALRPVQTLDTLNHGDSRLQLAIDRARRILGRDIPLLIQGESGAGKEMFAKAFHLSGARHAAPFVALNCAAIPENLIESELFGYEGGAFTGARKEGAPGKIQQAHGGTLFLDEIGDMPLHLQARLLRVLQERTVTPLGGTRSFPVDISLVCATHRKLREEVARGAFREDLYYRLNGLAVTLPSLRERSDRQALAEAIARDEAEKSGHAGSIGFSQAARAAIEGYAWPGNIRQLYNAIRVAIALMDDDETQIDIHHLPEELFEEAPIARPANPSENSSPATNASLDQLGRQAARDALAACGGNYSAAARRLGISRNTLYRKLGE